MSEKKSRILEAVHEMARNLYDAGVMKEKTMREFDALCLPIIPKYTPTEIKQIRLDSHASQTVFAAYMNISPSTVQKWEQGQKKPNGVALKLLNLIKRRGLEILAA